MLGQVEGPMEPMWRRIAEDLRQKIESGVLGADGRPLPSEIELQERYEASRNTIREAVRWLATRSLVDTRPGQGTFVKKIDPFVTRLSPDLTALPGGEGVAYASEVTACRRRASTSPPKVEILRATGRIVTELMLPEGAMVVSRHQERFIDDTPWSLQTTYYPMVLVQQGAARLIQAEVILPGAVMYIEDLLGRKRAGRRDRLVVRASDRRETDFFGLPDDGRIAVIELIQTVHDESGTPFVVSVTSFPADRNEFVMSSGTVPSDA
jgi:GntR family transcriptional regulator